MTPWRGADLAAGSRHGFRLLWVVALSSLMAMVLQSLCCRLGIAGQSSALTATMAGQVVMEGFLDRRLPPLWRRLLTRGLALLPALATVVLLGDQATNRLLLLSQVVLSLQLPFAVIPLVLCCGRGQVMGELRAPGWIQGLGWGCAGVIV